MAANSSPQPDIIASSHHDDDDIYSDRDGNESSLAPGSEALGPSDGYFRSSAESDAGSRAVDGEANQPREWRYGPAADTPRVPNVLIEDPTPSIRRARDKHQQAEDERRAVEQYISPVQSPVAASQRPAASMSAPSPANAGLRHSDAPPAYSPAQQQPSQGSSSWSEPENQGSSNTYGTMASGSVTSQDASRPPTSAADEEQPLLDSDDDSLRRRTSSSTRSRHSTRRWKQGMPNKYLRLLAILVIAIVLFTLFLLLQLINLNRPLEVRSPTYIILPTLTVFQGIYRQNSHSKVGPSSAATAMEPACCKEVQNVAWRGWERIICVSNGRRKRIHIFPIC